MDKTISVEPTIQSTCTKCKVTKDVGEFSIRKNRGKGHASSCKQCAREYQKTSTALVAYKESGKQAENSRKHAKTTKGKLSRKRHKVKKKYGISLDEYNMLLEKPCAICGNKSEVLDHCHVTNEPKKGLCSKCNMAIGLMNEDRNVALEAYIYIWENKLCKH